ncbi:MAG: hypothetical protein A2928_04425 [Candidatus Taylorbacteria bacterium RIFCSPLOWO2_01_FULL_45_15b]|uniref:Uncharacterized protein n=1 Tax=Candidatus Taylorbacteria bacterium RIFCSPLOWO2_01_FULL_45_15b TaxID=1802319 RepID=A0A1G2N8N3_9BACT|nr:MAG: hypothetical protein A2928_04425 [Candidatus Taylorbacteria bacterium RIFCSPLOWO2_01_FULL_45_15b]
MLADIKLYARKKLRIENQKMIMSSGAKFPLKLIKKIWIRHVIHAAERQAAINATCAAPKRRLMTKITAVEVNIACQNASLATTPKQTVNAREYAQTKN